jgi:outer membrane protein assembly factor BamB
MLLFCATNRSFLHRVTLPGRSDHAPISFRVAGRASVVVIGVLLFLARSSFLPAQGIGWRTDGSGAYLRAQPPLEWSPTKNVVWRTPMPGYGVSHPVPLDHRVFICAEPCTLLCLHRDDGKILWQKTSSYAELEIDPDTRAQLKIQLAETAELNKKQSAVQKEMDQLNRSLTKEKTPRKEIDKALQPFRKRIEEINKEKQKLTVAVRYTQPGTHPYAGYSAPTPVTDGTNVFVAFGNGLMACYDLDGNRKWLQLIEHSNAAFAHSGSPVLVGGKLLIHFTDLVALDPKTGKEVWRLKHGTSHGTPLVTRIGDVDVVLTPRGALVRAEDGKLLTDRLGSCGSNSPILHERTVYYVRGGVNAYRLPQSVAPPVKVQPLWKGKIKGDGYWFSSPVVHEGLLYATSDQGTLSVLGAGSGELIYEKRLNLRGSIYPSISLAGDHLYVSSDNGTTVVLKPGREYQELARNSLEPFRSSLVFEGKRLYVRTEKHLYCIGEEASLNKGQE